MAATVERKEYPSSMRLPSRRRDDRGSLRGRTRTDFVREAAVRAAKEIIMDEGPIRMSPESFADFMGILSLSAAPVPEMVELAKRPAPWEAGYKPKQ
ncbi:DUF1778 domain-containing protein [Rhizobium sp. Rhizsp42]|uniref:type II toxin-antitoxin system TacA family antitoxin n=1 Tax=Rhizobium sp. Rhizsp42 TaxID=3243034 RepID=UPI0039AF2ACF